MEAVDIDNNGSIDYTEFIAATMNRKKLLNKDNLEAAFKFFDKDGNGNITAQEIKEVLGGHVSEFDEELWNSLIKEVDENGDGEIQFDEFSTMMTRFLENSKI